MHRDEIRNAHVYSHERRRDVRRRESPIDKVLSHASHVQTRARTRGNPASTSGVSFVIQNCEQKVTHTHIKNVDVTARHAGR